MLNEAIYRSPNWLKRFADFEIHTGEDIKGEPSKGAIIKKFNKRLKECNMAKLKKFYVKIIDKTSSEDDFDKNLGYIKNKYKLDKTFWPKFDIYMDLERYYPYTDFSIDDDLLVDIIGYARPVIKNGKLPPIEINSMDSAFFIREELTSLKYSPKNVYSIFVEKNSLVDLSYSPRIVTNIFDVGNGKLKSLEGGPTQARSYSVHNNKITSFKGCPRTGEFFRFDNNLIWNLEYIPDVAYLSLKDNPVYPIWRSIGSNYKNAELFNDYDILREDDNGDKVIIKERLIDFYKTIKKNVNFELFNLKTNLDDTYPDFYKFV